MSRISYSSDIPIDILELIKRTFDPYEDLIPGWCEDLRIHWRPSTDCEDNGIAGETISYYEYRWAEIYICPVFLEQLEHDRKQTASHEIVHVLLAPWANGVDFLVGVLAGDNKALKAVLEEQMREKLEMVTQDIATYLNKLENQYKNSTTD